MESNRVYSGCRAVHEAVVYGVTAMSQRFDGGVERGRVGDGCGVEDGRVSSDCTRGSGSFVLLTVWCLR